MIPFKTLSCLALELGPSQSWGGLLNLYMFRVLGLVLLPVLSVKISGEIGYMGGATNFACKVKNASGRIGIFVI